MNYELYVYDKENIIDWVCYDNLYFLMLLILDGSNIGNNNWCANSSSCDNWSITLGRIRMSSLCCTSNLCNKATGILQTCERCDKREFFEKVLS